MTFLQKLWKKAVLADAFMYQGVRKILQNITVENPALPRISFEDFGFGQNKLKQLQRNYVDNDEFYRVRQILQRRSDAAFTSVALSLRGAKKDSRSQGWCMLSMVVARKRDYETLEIQYRSTELVLKFGGDLAFLPWLCEKLEIQPNVVRWRFANCYLSGVYFPYLTNWWDPIEFLEFLWGNDRKLFEQGTRFWLRSAYKRDQVFPYSPENVAHKFNWLRNSGTMVQIRDYLEERHKTFGKPLPKLHYKEGTYVPRGKRKAEEEE